MQDGPTRIFWANLTPFSHLTPARAGVPTRQQRRWLRLQ
jgi:hypothetical protein